MANTSKAHKTVVAELVDQINDADFFQTVVVEPYKTLTGASGAIHQFDIYWEFRSRSGTRRCIIDAESWDRPVSVGGLRRLQNALNDLQDSISGIFLGSSGFEKEARDYAGRCGVDVWIYPFTIEATNDAVTFFVAKFEDVSPVFDEAWIENVLKPKLTEGASVPTQPDSANETTRIFDELCAVRTVRDVLNEYYLAERIVVPAHEICVIFDKPTYIETEDTNAPMLKIRGLNAVFSVTTRKETLRRVSTDYAHGAIEFIVNVFG